MITKKKPQPSFGNHIRSKGSLIGTISLEKQKKRDKILKEQALKRVRQR